MTTSAKTWPTKSRSFWPASNLTGKFLISSSATSFISFISLNVPSLLLSFLTPFFFFFFFFLFRDSKSEAAQAGTLSTSELCKDVGANEQAYWNFICRYPSIASGSIPATLEDKVYDHFLPLPPSLLPHFFLTPFPQPEADQHKKKVLEALHKSKLRYYDKQISLAAKLSKVKAKKKEKAADNKPDEGDIPDDEDEVSPEASVEQFQPGYINPRFSFCGKDGAVTDAVLREHSLLRLPENLLRFLRRFEFFFFDYLRFHF